MYYATGQFTAGQTVSGQIATALEVRKIKNSLTYVVSEKKKMPLYW